MLDIFRMYNEEIIGLSGRISAIFALSYKLSAMEQRVLQSLFSWCFKHNTNVFIRSHAWKEDNATITHVGFNKVINQLEKKEVVSTVGEKKQEREIGKAEIYKINIECEKVVHAELDLKQLQKKTPTVQK